MKCRPCMVVVFLLGAVASALACEQQPQQPVEIRGAGEAAAQTAWVEFFQTHEQKDAGMAISLFARNLPMQVFEGDMVRGKEQVRGRSGQILGGVSFVLCCELRNVEMSRSMALPPRAQESSWRKMLKEILLPPSAFKHLPKPIQKRLEERGCMIPQTFASEEPHNVIHGEFARPGQKDWAVLCSNPNDGESTILVFWGMPTACPDELAPRKDHALIYATGSIQPDGSRRPEYYRRINPVDADYILEHYERYGGLKPPPIDHEGIDDAMLEKASEVYYCYEGKWLSLTGAD